MNTQTAPKRALQWRDIAESHRRQLAGEDFQAVAVEIATRLGFEWESDEYTQLQGMPDAGCECSACRAHDWES